MNDEVKKYSGNLFIVSAPSGAGKTSLLARCIQENPSLNLSVSHTTRPPRTGEVNGQDYHFVSREDFETMISEAAFLESAEVFGHYYGTSQAEVEKQLSEGKDVVLEIDWQGAQQIRKKFGEAISIFILPPSLEVLKQRLSDRGQDKEEVIARRLAEARKEISHYLEFDYLIINEDFDTAAGEMNAIFKNAQVQNKSRSQASLDLVGQLLDTEGT